MQADLTQLSWICFRWFFAQLDPFGVESSLFVHTLVGVGSEVVSLGLQQIGWQSSQPVTVVVAQRRAESWYWNAQD